MMTSWDHDDNSYDDDDGNNININNNNNNNNNDWCSPGVINKTKQEDTNTHAVSPESIDKSSDSALTKLLPKSEYIAGFGNAHVSADNIINHAVIKRTIAFPALLIGLVSFDSIAFSINNSKH